MSADRAGRRRTGHRAFRPTLNGRVEMLEPRLLLTRIKNVLYGLPKSHGGHYVFQTTDGGRGVLITTPLNEQFVVQLTSTLNNGTTGVTNVGTVRAYVVPGGGGISSVGLRVDGTTPDTDLTINFVNPYQRKRNISHTFSQGQALQNHLLYVGAIQVTSGQIGDIEGYHTAVLTGPISVGGTNPVDRIALNSIAPGGSIFTGGNLNTLDVLYNMDFSGPGTGINVGQDLNWFNTLNGNVTLSNGANIFIGRDLGLVPQGAKGSGAASGGNAAEIYGNLTINPGSAFAIGRSLAHNFLIFGNFNGASRFSQGVVNPNGMIAVGGTITP
jgi:hypothetical protein